MKSVWAELGKIQQHRPGAQAYAFQKAEMYERRRVQVYKNLKNLGYAQLLEETANVISFVDGERRKEAAVLEDTLTSVV